MNLRRVLPVAILTATAVAPFVSAQQPCASPPADMVVWWDGDAVQGAVAHDLLGQADATRSNAGNVPTTTGVVGRALDFRAGTFDLRTDYPALPSSTFTIEAWIQVPTSSQPGLHRTIVAQNGGAPSPGQFCLRVLTSGQVQLVRRTGTSATVNTVASVNPVPANVPVHVAAVYRGGSSSYEIWINGQNSSTSVFTSSWVTNNGPVVTTIGSNGGGEPFVGTIDELTFYGRALSASEIQAIAFAGSAGKCKTCATPPAGAEAWWTGDQRCGGFQLDSMGRWSAKDFGTQTKAGIVGLAMHFDGADSVSVGAPVLATTGPFAVEAWVRPDSYRLGGIVGEVGNTSGSVAGQFAVRMLSSGQVQIYRKTGSGDAVTLVATQAKLPLSEWTHVVAQYDGTDLQVWWNGAAALVTKGTSSYTPTMPLQTTLGAGEAGRWLWDGDLDEVALYRRVLTASEIDALYRAGRWGRCAVPSNQIACVPGSGHDFTLDSLLGAQGFPDAQQKAARPGDVMVLTMRSPNGGWVGSFPVLLLDLYANGSAPGPFPGFPALQLDLGRAFVASSALGPFGNAVLPPQGSAVAYQVPAGLGGFTARFQAASFLAGAFAFSPARDFQMR